MSETVGKRLRRLREAAGLSQRDLQEPGVSYAYISRLEADTRVPSVRALRKIAPKLGVTPEFLEFGIDITTTDHLLRELTEWDDVVDVVVRVTPSGVEVQWGEPVSGVAGATLTECLVKAVAVEKDRAQLRVEKSRLERELEQIETKIGVTA